MHTRHPFFVELVVRQERVPPLEMGGAHCPRGCIINTPPPPPLHCPRNAARTPRALRAVGHGRLRHWQRRTMAGGQQGHACIRFDTVTAMDIGRRPSRCP